MILLENNISAENIAAYLGILVGAITILFWIYNGFVNILDYFRSRNVKKGIYQGYWNDPANKQINCEILRLKKTINGIKLKPLYKHKSYHNYVLHAKPIDVNKYIFKGKWKTHGRNLYKGPALFLLDDENNQFTGKWLGPRRSGEINGGDWIIKYYQNKKNQYLIRNWRKMVRNLSEKIWPKPSIISDIIKKHEEYGSNECNVEGILLKLSETSFNPILGKISIPTVKYVSSLVKSTDKVLDLGTGTGFYPIYLAKKNRCKVTGVDINESILNLAINNSIENDTIEFTDFRRSTEKNLFQSIEKDEYFDYIIANLPFSSIASTYKSRMSPLYRCFATSETVLENLILGSQFHMKPNGKLIFCFGESGYTKLLDSLVDVSSWDHLKLIETIKDNDDTFYIYQLGFNDFVKNAHQKFKKLYPTHGHSQ